MSSTTSPPSSATPEPPSGIGDLPDVEHPVDVGIEPVDHNPAGDDPGTPDRNPAGLFANPPTLEGVVSFLIVAASAIFVLVEMHPGLLLKDTLPTGGDMGAHVWGPAFLRDELLPNLRLSGWTPDWYAGFPAYQFYMVLPSLVIVALNVGLHPVLSVLVLIALAGIVTIADRRGLLEGARSHAVAVVVTILAVLAIGVPYGVAFKIVAVSGLVTMPISGWALGRLSNMPFPIPPLLAVATLPFIFDRSFNIYGGNAASTMAGEFAFSISLSLSLVFLGMFQRALDTGRNRGWATVLYAVTLLCHLIPAAFAAVVAIIMLTVRVGRRQTLNSVGIGVCGVLLSAFWLGPFLLRRELLNDMGWEKLTTYTNYLFSRNNLNPADTLLNSPPFQLVFIVGLVGLVLSIISRNRLGVVLALAAAVGAAGFRFAPQSRLWNARLLPFYYLSVYLLAGLGIALLLRMIAQGISTDSVVRRAFRASGALMTFLAIFVALGLPLGALPGGSRDGNGVYSWGPLETTDRSYVPGWSDWNFSGYQAKTGDASGGGWAEFRQLMVDMDGIGQQQGCGRSLWEFSSELNRYGTTMAPMLLPHFTDGCIGSMEGLYFESSASVPYHFLMQSELGESNSRAQRDLPYSDFDINLGVDHLQLYGVKYYLAFSDLAVNAARAHPDLAELATSGPWVAFGVAGSELVSPLGFAPAVMTNVGPAQDEWLDVGVEFFQQPSNQDVFLAADGPDEWQRIDMIEVVGPPLAEGEAEPPKRWGGVVPSADLVREPVAAVQVSNIVASTNTISFDVDQVGSPVLVKASYFPNWKANGAEGPFRVTPNLMVVVPTSTEVTLSYGHTWVEYLSWLLTALGVVGLVLLSRRDSRPDAPLFDPVASWLTAGVDLEGPASTGDTGDTGRAGVPTGAAVGAGIGASSGAVVDEDAYAAGYRDALARVQAEFEADGLPDIAVDEVGPSRGVDPFTSADESEARDDDWPSGSEADSDDPTHEY